MQQSLSSSVALVARAELGLLAREGTATGCALEVACLFHMCSLGSCLIIVLSSLYETVHEL